MATFYPFGPAKLKHQSNLDPNMIQPHVESHCQLGRVRTSSPQYHSGVVAHNLWHTCNSYMWPPR
eukprot:scaffold854_cov343-Prasinococcus_capsulatus_cf.AAC.1